MNIYTLKAGRDTDALIAERVYHYRREKVPKDARGENGGNDVLVPPGLHPGETFGYQYPVAGAIPLYWFCAPWTTEILDALQLWDHLATAGWQCSLVHKPFEALPDDRWVFHGVRLINGKWYVSTEGRNTRSQRIESFSAHADTRALAIARGALASAKKERDESKSRTLEISEEVN